MCNYCDGTKKPLAERRDEIRQRDYEAEEAAYYAEAEREYIEDMLNSMNPHDRKHALNPRRIDLKGGHHHRRNYCICSQCGHW